MGCGGSRMEEGAAIAGERVKLGGLVADGLEHVATLGYSTPLTQALGQAANEAHEALDAVPPSGYAETPSQRRKLDGMIGEVMDALRAARAALKAKPEPGA